jgi:hypothetical protein
MMQYFISDVNLTALMRNGLFDVGIDRDFGQTQIAID